MTTENAFKANFITPLVECYGASKFPPIRVQAIWQKIKSLPDESYRRIADKIVLNNDNFPGTNAIIAICNETVNEFANKEADRLKSTINCHKCRSQGVIMANSYAYRCSCKLGDLLYPNFALYAGETTDPETYEIDSSGDIVVEKANYIMRTPQKFEGVSKCSFVIKDHFDRSK